MNIAVETAYLQTLQMRQVSTQVQSAADEQQAVAPAPTTQTPADPAPEPAMGMVMEM